MKNRFILTLVFLIIITCNFQLKSQIKGVIKNCEYNLFESTTSDCLLLKDSPNIQISSICVNFGDSTVYMDYNKKFYFHFYYKSQTYKIQAYLKTIDYNSAQKLIPLDPKIGYTLDFDILFPDTLVKKSSDYLEFLKKSRRTFFIDLSDKYLLNNDSVNHKKFIIQSDNFTEKY